MPVLYATENNEEREVNRNLVLHEIDEYGFVWESSRTDGNVFVPSFIMTVDYCYYRKLDRMGCVLRCALCVPRIPWINPLILINAFCCCCY